jgi:hypothetical protein
VSEQGRVLEGKRRTAFGSVGGHGVLLQRLTRGKLCPTGEPIIIS